MNKTGSLLNKTLVIGFIVLFCGISVQPCIAIVQKENRLESNSEPSDPIGDPKWLANMQVEFGEKINNEKIIWKPFRFKPAGTYYVHLYVKFRCPIDRKIVINYRFKVTLTGVFDWVTFLEYKDTFTIINGSNPPDIRKDFINFIPPNHWKVDLIISSNLSVYKFLNGNWIEVDNDNIDCRDWRTIRFIKSRTSEIKQIFMRLFDRFPNREVLLRIMNLLR